MIDFTNKTITTKSDLESEQLLKKAVAQGFGLPKGEKALTKYNKNSPSSIGGR